MIHASHNRAVFASRVGTYINPRYCFVKISKIEYTINDLAAKRDNVGLLCLVENKWNGSIIVPNTNIHCEVEKFCTHKSAYFALLMKMQITKLERRFPQVKIFYNGKGGSSTVEETADYNQALQLYVAAYNHYTNGEELRILNHKRFE